MLASPWFAQEPLHETLALVTDAAGDGPPIPFRRSPDVTLLAGEEHGESVFYLKTVRGVFLIGAQEHWLWQALDGRASFATVAHGFARQFGRRLGEESVGEFITHGMRTGLLERADPGAEAATEPAADLAAGRSRRRSPYRRSHLQEGVQDFTRFGRQPWTVILGDPTKFFAILAFLLGPLRHARWVPIPFAFLASMVIIKNWTQYNIDYHVMVFSIPFWPCMYSYEHALNIIARTIEGTIIQAQGGVVRYFGVRFFMGVMLRAFIDEETATTISEQARLWSKGGVLLLRLALFDLGMFTWALFRATKPDLAMAGLFFGEISLLTFALNMCPLLHGEGYELMITYLDQPKLLARAFNVMKISFSRRQLPADMTGTERMALFLFAIGSILFTAMICLKIMMDMNKFIIGAQGLGYLVMTCAWASLVIYFVLLVRYHRRVGVRVKRIAREGQQKGARVAQTTT